MSKNSFRDLLLIAFVLAAAVTLTVPSRLLEYLETKPAPARPIDGLNPDAPPLTASLPLSGTPSAAPTAAVDEGTAPAVRFPIPAELRQPIIVYHHVRPPIVGQPTQEGLEVTPEIFEQQLAWLAGDGWSVVSLSDYVDALEGRRQLPAKAAVLTFDDGNRDQYQNALPVLRQRGLKATFFIYPNAIGKRDDFMNWEQVRDLVAAGMTIGSHSAGHPRLYQMTNSTQIDLEVRGSKEKLEKETGSTVLFFAYPFGVESELSQQAVRQAGYRGARVYPYGPNNTPDDIFKLKSVAAPYDLKRFKKILENSL